MKKFLKSTAKGLVKGVVKTAIPGAGVAMDTAEKIRRARTNNPVQDTDIEEVEMDIQQPFKNRDADQHGAKKYGSASQNRADHEVVCAQFQLACDGFLTFGDIDGCVGPGTLRAIEAWEKSTGRNFYTEEPLGTDTDDTTIETEGAEVEGAFMLGGFPLVRQFDPEYAGYEFGELEKIIHESGRVEKTRPGRIGAHGCGLVCCSQIASYLAGHSISVSPIDIAEEMDERDGFFGRAIRWDSMADVMTHHSGTQHVFHQKYPVPVDDPETQAEVVKLIRGGTPVLIRVSYEKAETYSHFVLGIGVTDSGEIVFHDPGCGDPEKNTLSNSRKNYGFVGYGYFAEV